MPYKRVLRMGNAPHVRLILANRMDTEVSKHALVFMFGIPRVTERTLVLI